MVIASGIFKDTKKHTPKIKLQELTVDVYFICEGKLYKGNYHTNGCFYAYKTGGQFDCFASKEGRYRGLGNSGVNEVCTHWCYVDEFVIEEII